MTTFMYMIEIIGTIAFAVSGAILAIKKGMDLFGVIVLGVITAVGGGMIRDILLGILPPTMFLNSIYVMIAIFTSIIIFLLMYFMRETLSKYTVISDYILNIFDAVGLGVFVVAGVNTAAVHGLGHMTFLSIFVGVLTGVGGGVLRDILALRVPVILQKRIYAVAALIGSAGYYYLDRYIDNRTAMIVSIIIVCMIRMFATYGKWNLPRIPD